MILKSNANMTGIKKAYRKNRCPLFMNHLLGINQMYKTSGIQKYDAIMVS